MTCDELNLKYIDEKFKNNNITIEDSSLLQDILEICKEFYREGFKQNLFDKRMLEHELEILKEVEEEHQKLNGELQQKINNIIEIIELNQYSYGYQIKEEIMKGENEKG